MKMTDKEKLREALEEACAELRFGNQHNKDRSGNALARIEEAQAHLATLDERRAENGSAAQETIAGRTDAQEALVPLSLLNLAIEVLQTLKNNAGYGKETNQYAGYRLEDLTIKRQEEVYKNHRAALSAPVSNGWMDIATAPKTGRYMGIILQKTGTYGEPFICEWDEDDGHSCQFQTGHFPDKPTHWQPLPTPPQDKKGVMMKSKIITYHAYPPIPERRFDWCAYRDGTEDGGLQGWGKTEADAVSDLIQREGE